jgi:hypothetical protein
VGLAAGEILMGVPKFAFLPIYLKQKVGLAAGETLMGEISEGSQNLHSYLYT